MSTLAVADNLGSPGLLDAASVALAIWLKVTVADNAANLADAVVLTLGLNELPSDNLSNWADAQAFRESYEVPVSDTGSLSDALLINESYELPVTDNGNNLADAAQEVLGILISFADSENNLADATQVTSTIAASKHNELQGIDDNFSYILGW